MRRVLTSLLVLAALAAVPSVASAQTMPGDRQGQRPGQRPGQEQGQQAPERDRAPRFAPLRQRPNAGPCPYVKILYDGARYVELANNQPATANVGFTGEIQGLSSTCRYREAEPITVDMNVLFSFGRGPQASGDQRTYRYWIAVTERNSAVLAKEYFDVPVNFQGRQTAELTEERTIVIPRAELTTSGGNFEILVGFEVTPEMAEFNRSGSRFRVNAGTTPVQ